jgi:hypothetical protein
METLEGCDDEVDDDADGPGNAGGLQLRFDETIQFDDPNPGAGWAPTLRQIREWSMIFRESGAPTNADLG